MEEEPTSRSDPRLPKVKLTGGQTWVIAGLLFLQIPSSLIFYPLAAVLSLTAILIPVSMVLIGVGTLPYSYAMKCKRTWQSAEGSNRAVGEALDPSTAASPPPSAIPS